MSAKAGLRQPVISSRLLSNGPPQQREYTLGCGHTVIRQMPAGLFAHCGTCMRRAESVTGEATP